MNNKVLLEAADKFGTPLYIYDSNMIKEIMYANKDMAYGRMSVSAEGLMKLEFEDEKIKSTYYTVAKEK